MNTEQSKEYSLKHVGTQDAELEKLATIVINEAFCIHQDLGPGLLESVYQKVLAEVLRQRGLKVETELPISFSYRGISFEAELRLDLLVNDSLIVELKSTEQNNPVHKKQLTTYLKLMKKDLGLLINFGLTSFKSGCKRVITKAMSVNETFEIDETVK